MGHCATFDPTLGFPGEGPPTLRPFDSEEWAFEDGIQDQEDYMDDWDGPGGEQGGQAAPQHLAAATATQQQRTAGWAGQAARVR